MAKAKKDKRGEFITVYCRNVSPGKKLPQLQYCFMIGETMEQLAEWHKADRYGFTERDFHRVCTVKLSVMMQHNGESLPWCGAYEQATWLYQIPIEEEP